MSPHHKTTTARAPGLALGGCLLSTLFWAPAPASAQTTPPAKPPAAPALTEEQTASIRKQLEQLEAQVSKGRGDVLGPARTKFRAAMAGQKEALALYLDCYKLAQFDRKDLKQADFQAWKERNEDRLKDEDFLAGLRLQLEFLVLSLQAQEVREQKDMAPLVVGLQAFLPKAVAAVQSTSKRTASGAVEEKDKDARPGGRPGGDRPGREDRPGGNRPGGGGGGPGGGAPGGGGFVGGGQLGGILRQSVKSTEFSNAFLLEDHLHRKEWSYVPLDIPGIYELVIFPFYLDQKPSELPAQWDARINAELALQKIALSESEYAVLAKDRHPELLWAKATYLLDNNLNPLSALADMLKIVRDHPVHPQAATWLKHLRTVVDSGRSGPQPPASPPKPPAVD